MSFASQRRTRSSISKEKEQKEEEEKPKEQEKHSKKPLRSFSSLEDNFIQPEFEPRITRSRTSSSIGDFQEPSQKKRKISSSFPSQVVDSPINSPINSAISSISKPFPTPTNSYHLRSAKKSKSKNSSEVENSSSSRSKKKSTSSFIEKEFPIKGLEDWSFNLQPVSKKKMEKSTKSIVEDFFQNPEDLEDETDDEFQDELNEDSFIDPQTQLQSLLRRLGVVQPQNSSRLRNILESLNSDLEEKQLMGVQELCEILSMSTEDTLIGFSPDQFIPPLVQLMSMEHNPEMMLYACRCIHNMVEALPHSVNLLIHLGAVPIICEKLHSIEYIDLAEQAITTLEKLSQAPVPQLLISIVRNGGLIGVLNILDFFPTGVQRCAISAAANLCKYVPEELFERGIEASKILTNLLNYQDHKIIEKSCIAVARLVDCFSRSSDKLRALASQELLNNLVRLISSSNPSQVGAGIFTSIVRLLGVLCKNCPSVALDLMENTDLVKILREILGSTSSLSSTSLASTPQEKQSLTSASPSVSRPSEQLSELLLLCSELLPPLPKTGIFCTKNTSTQKELAQKSLGMKKRTKDRSLIDSLEIADVEKLAKEIAEKKEKKSKKNEVVQEDSRKLRRERREKREIEREEQEKIQKDQIEEEEKEKEKEKDSKLEKKKRKEDKLKKGEKKGKKDKKVDEESQDEKKEKSKSERRRSKGKELEIEDVVMESPNQDIEKIVTTPDQDYENDEEFKSDVRVKSLKENQKLMMTFSKLLLPVLLDVFSTTVSPTIKHNCVNSIIKIIFFSSSETLEDALKDIPLSNFISGLLSARDLVIVVGGLQLCDNLLIKLPNIFKPRFLKEGVIHELQRLSKPLETSRSSSKLKSKLQDNSDLFQTPKSRRSIYSSNEELKPWIHEQSKKFCETYFQDTENLLTTTAISKLLEISKSLKEKNFTQPQAFSILEELATILCEGSEGVSAFQLLNGQIVDGLLNFLTTKDKVEERVKTFIRVFMKGPLLSFEKKSDNMELDSLSQPFSYLVKRLHEVLNKLEQFPILIHEVVGSESKSGLGGLKVLTQPFKLKLQRIDEDESSLLKDYSENLIMVEPLASIQSIENFLWPKISSQPQPSEKSKSKSKTGGKSSKSKIFGDLSESEEDLFADSKSLEEVDDLVLGESTEQIEHLEGPSTSNSTQSLAKPTQKLEMYLGDTLLSPNNTIFQSVEKFCRLNTEKSREKGRDKNQESSGKYMWSSVYTIKYKLSKNDGESIDNLDKRKSIEGGILSILEPFHLKEVSSDLPLFSVLHLLKVLSIINSSWFELYDSPTTRYHSAPLNTNEFTNSKLSAKLTRQLHDPLSLCSSSFPEWCQELTSICPFLFNFETRYMYLYSSSFGIARSLMKLQERSLEHQPETSNETFKIGRIQRQKVRISREKILESAIKVMELYASSKAILEIEYFNEVGTGLGPTLEFYTNASKEFQKKSFNLWRDSSDNQGEYVFSPKGLFPRPLSSQAKSSEKGRKILYLFNIIGKFVGKALLDFRTIDLPLSPVFFSCVLGHELSSRDLFDIDPEFAKSFKELEQFCEEKKKIQNNPSISKEEKVSQLKQLRLKGAEIDSLCMDFTLPGFPEIELKENGANISVTLENIEEFVQLIIKSILNDSVKLQFESFKKGFSSVFPLEDLKIFTSSEIDLLINGTEEKWDREMLSECVKSDHGYSYDSVAMNHLISIMSEFSSQQQRDFLKFITGSPRLPVGGLRTLSPRLTVVRKTPEVGSIADDYLPSAMTCVNYLKLPDYTSKEVMYDKLILAMTEGQESFHLS